MATINGVTDVPLMFQGSDGSMNDYARDWMRERVGDPEKDLAKLVRISPVYRVRDRQFLLEHIGRRATVEPTR